LSAFQGLFLDGHFLFNCRIATLHQKTAFIPRFARWFRHSFDKILEAMKKNFLLVGVCLAVFVRSDGQDKVNKSYRNFPVIITIQFHSLTLPFRDFKSNFSNVGFGVGTEVSNSLVPHLTGIRPLAMGCCSALKRYGGLQSSINFTVRSKRALDTTIAFGPWSLIGRKMENGSRLVIKERECLRFSEELQRGTIIILRLLIFRHS
jgi:hypothetical protein